MGNAELVERFPGLSRRLLERAGALFPVRVTRSWLARMQDPQDPLGRQALPGDAELRPDPGDLTDPVGEGARSPLPWLVQKHPDRVLLLLTRRCHLYCRYCFRRAHRGPEDPTPAELDAALAFVRACGARELILSGGDPLAVRDRVLFGVIDAVRPEVPTIRIHSRAPITAPDRITPGLVTGLASRGAIWVIVHCNHPDELSGDVTDALARLVDAGVPVLNQAVLLAGVNDDPDVLAELCVALTQRRVFPYYLHHPDHVTGNAAFRVELERGLDIYHQLSARVSGVALPRYVIDPPDGGGKLDVAEWVSAGYRRPVPCAPTASSLRS